MRPSEHRLLKLVLPERVFEAVKAGTQQWLAECPCGHKQDYWDLGGVRYKAAGQPRQLAPCPVCGKRTLHTIRRKTEAERRTLP